MTRLFVTDLDGTLFRDDTTVSPFTAQALNRLIDAGHAITYCTARSPMSARRVLAPISFRMPAAVFGGAAIIAPDGSLLSTASLDIDLVDTLIAAGEQHQQYPLVFGFEGGGGAERICYLRAHRFAQDAMFSGRRRDDPRLREVVSFPADFRPIMVSFVAPPDALLALHTWAQVQLAPRTEILFVPHVGAPGHHVLEFTPRGANKGAGVRALAEVVGARLPDVTVFGDHTNDLPMFEVAGRRVAVANAVPAIRAAADMIIGPNEEDAVARYLLEQLAVKAEEAC